MISKSTAALVASFAFASIVLSSPAWSQADDLAHATCMKDTGGNKSVCDGVHGKSVAALLKALDEQDKALGGKIAGGFFTGGKAIAGCNSAMSHIKAGTNLSQIEGALDKLTNMKECGKAVIDDCKTINEVLKLKKPLLIAEASHCLAWCNFDKSKTAACAQDKAVQKR